MNDDNRALNDSVSSALDRSVEQLDAATLSALKQARLRALTTRVGFLTGTTAWLAAGALVTLAVVIIASLPLLAPQQTHPENMAFTSLDDAELIVASDDFELMEDLDFVTWMITRDDAG